MSFCIFLYTFRTNVFFEGLFLSYFLECFSYDGFSNLLTVSPKVLPFVML
jgi:hypothetical protein